MKVFDPNLKFYKGNMHMHTTRSDGAYTPEAAIELYRKNGYDFLAVTDHWETLPTGWADNMLLMSGIEIDIMLETQVIHIVGVGMDVTKFPKLSRGIAMQAGIDAILAAGGRAILAHPAWSLNTLEPVDALKGFSAMEVYNTFSGAPWNGARADSCYFLDMAAQNGRFFRVVASDDSHRYTGETCQSFTRVQAQELSNEGILAGLDSGRYYASQGPEFLQIERTEKEIIVHCSPVSTALFYSNLYYADDRCIVGENMTEIIYPIQHQRGEKFVRCEVIDAQGKRAWSQFIQIA